MFRGQPHQQSEMEERNAGIEAKIKEMDTLVKENLDLKISRHKTSRKSGTLLKDQTYKQQE